MISIFPKQARAREGALGAQWRQHREYKADARTRCLPAGVGAPAGPDEGWYAYETVYIASEHLSFGCVKCFLQDLICFCFRLIASFFLPYFPLCLLYIFTYLSIFTCIPQSGTSSKDPMHLSIHV